MSAQPFPTQECVGHSLLSGDPKLAQILDEYLAAMATGAAPSRAELFARYPEQAQDLQECLASLEFIRQAAVPPVAPQANGGDSSTALLSSETGGGNGVLGDFRILREIGRGGMGVVYEAEQVSLSRRVALKVLPFAAALDAKQLQRFKNEAHAAAGLQHTNIVPVYFVGCERGVHFYAMQYVEGQTLAALIQELRRLEGRNGEGRDGEARREGEAPAEPVRKVGSNPLQRVGDRPAEAGHYEPQKEARQGMPAYPPRPPEGLASELISGRWAGAMLSPGQPKAELSSSEAEARRKHATPCTTGPYVSSTPVDQTPQAETATPPVGALSTEQSTKRPAFFRTVASLGIQAAEALEHAHQLGVIHRDIKPANMMVDARGNLWITDFGLAHCQGSAELTMSGDLLGTLRYMSPEQALAKRVIVDERTDIYSLGVTLYELLTLEPAFPGTDRQELLRQIAFEDPLPPRRLNKAIPAEMETILLKAMAKNPDERYATAQEVGDDFRRFLEDKPIKAKRPNLWQRLRKWRRRHKTLVTAASVILLILLVAAAASSLVMWRALKAETQAKGRTQESLKLALHVLGGIHQQLLQMQTSSDPQIKQDQEALLQRTLEFYQRFAEDNASDPTVRIEVARTYAEISNIYKFLGYHVRSKELFIQAMQMAEEVATELPNEDKYQVDLAAAYCDMARWPAEEGDYRTAVDFNQRAVKIMSNLSADAFTEPRCSFVQARNCKELADHLCDQGKWEAAAKYYRQAIDIQNNLVEQHAGDPVFQQELGVSHNHLGMALMRAGDRIGAKEHFWLAIKVQTDLADRLPKGHLRSDSILTTSFIHQAEYQAQLAHTHKNLGDLLHEYGERTPAQSEYDQALTMWQNAVSKQPNVVVYRSGVAIAHVNLGEVLKEKSELSKASEHFRQAIDLLTSLSKDSGNLPYDRCNLANGHFHFGELLEDSGQTHEAEIVYRQAFSICEKLSLEFPQVCQHGPILAGSAFALAHLLWQTGRSKEAKEICRKAMELAPDDEETQDALAWLLANCPDRELRDPFRAVELAGKAAKAVPGREEYWNTLGTAQFRTGDLKAALQTLEHSMQLGNGGDCADWFFAAMAYWQRGQKDEARQWYDKAIRGMGKGGARHVHDKDLRRIQTEATGLLGIQDQTQNEKVSSKAPKP